MTSRINLIMFLLHYENKYCLEQKQHIETQTCLVFQQDARHFVIVTSYFASIIRLQEQFSIKKSIHMTVSINQFGSIVILHTLQYGDILKTSMHCIKLQ